VSHAFRHKLLPGVLISDIIFPFPVHHNCLRRILEKRSKKDRSCRKIYGSSRPSICVASVLIWSLEYAGTILSETPRSSPPPIFPVSRTSSPRGENSLFGHVVRLDDHTPVHRALSQVAAVRTGSCLNSGWRRRPGRPRYSWIRRIGDGTPFGIGAEWSKDSRRWHSRLTQRTSAVCGSNDDDDEVRNENIRRTTGQALLEYAIKERRLRWFGHVQEMENDRQAKQALHWIWTPTGKRKKEDQG